MKGRPFAVCCLAACVAIAGCGGSGKVSASSLQPRLLPHSSVPGFGLQRTFDWSDPVNLVGEGLALPATTRPREAVDEFSGAHLRGAAGEMLAQGSALNETNVQVGVARFDSASDANRVRDWMHEQDLKQPCFRECVFSPGSVAVSGIPSARFVVQTSHAPPPQGPPPGVKIPAGVKVPRTVVGEAPANYLAEFTIGPYLYWAILHGNSSAKTRFEAGLKLYYAHARESA